MNATSATDRVPTTGDDYQNMLAALRDGFAAETADGDPLFETDIDGGALWQAYLDALPTSERQEHNCHACRHFVERFGGLVSIRAGGVTVPVMWGDEPESDLGHVRPAPGIYGPAFYAVRDMVARARVTGVFLSSLSTWGTGSNFDAKQSKTWRHMHIASTRIYRAGVLKTAGQAMAEKREEHGMLHRGLAEFKHETLVQALAIASSEALYRGEKVQGHLQWLVNLSTACRAVKNHQHRDNLVWVAVATAPVGFAHVRTSMVGTLLEDLEAGLDLESIKRKFADKMDPLQYRRPTAAPSDGAIAEAEKIVAALGTAGSLRRRFATLDDIEAIWKPSPPPTQPGKGVFGHLKQTPPTAKFETITAPPITFEKFRRTVLPTAAAIEVRVPARGSFIALVTAADPAAPPIIQWDRADRRNPVSWYVYPHGSSAQQWGLVGDTYAKLTAITLMPFMWEGMADHGNHGAGAVLVIDGAKDSRASGSALFPELLRSEYHGVRSVIERYSSSAALEGREQASACGLDLRKGDRADKHSHVNVRVTSTAGTITDYTIDRWD